MVSWGIQIDIEGKCQGQGQKKRPKPQQGGPVRRKKLYIIS